MSLDHVGPEPWFPLAAGPSSRVGGAVCLPEGTQGTVKGSWQESGQGPVAVADLQAHQRG